MIDYLFFINLNYLYYITWDYLRIPNTQFDRETALSTDLLGRLRPSIYARIKNAAGLDQTEHKSQK